MTVGVRRQKALRVGIMFKLGHSFLLNSELYSLRIDYLENID